MCGIEYCGACAPPPELVAWTEGHHHTMPTFGDAAQQRVATYKRAATFERMKDMDPEAAKAFPEFLRSGERAKYVQRFAEKMRLNFDYLLVRDPEFAAFVRIRPHDVAQCGIRGRAGRKVRRHLRHAWQTHVILSYLLETGITGLRRVHMLFSWTLPWWARPVPAMEQERQMLLAA